MILCSKFYFAHAQESCFFPIDSNGEYSQRVCVQVDGTSIVTDVQDAPVPSGFADLDTFYVLVAAYLVFLMQLGFALVEAGAVSMKNTTNILFKNVMDAIIGAIVFYVIGYAFAYGRIDDNAFIGVTNFALSKEDGTTYEYFLFQWAFAATAATIVSGSMAERTNIWAYLAYTVCLTGFIYPVVVHWVWDSNGWLSASNPNPLWSGNPSNSNGFIDFAGSSVVHMVGGLGGLVGAIIIGPRSGRFEINPDGTNGKPLPRPGHNIVLQAMGTCILWFGWYGFNAGSTLGAVGLTKIASLVAVNTIISAASCSITCMAIGFYWNGNFEFEVVLNGIIGGLVSITASCATVEPWHALLIGVIGALVYFISSKCILWAHIDDPIDAAAVHGFCGIWATLAVGIFSTDDNIARAGYNDTDFASSGRQFSLQLVGMLVILAWILSTSFVMFLVIDKTIGLRVSADIEEEGIDLSEHGSKAYNSDIFKRRISDVQMADQLSGNVLESA